MQQPDFATLQTFAIVVDTGSLSRAWMTMSGILAATVSGDAPRALAKRSKRRGSPVR